MYAQPLPSFELLTIEGGSTTNDTSGIVLIDANRPTCNAKQTRQQQRAQCRSDRERPADLRSVRGDHKSQQALALMCISPRARSRHVGNPKRSLRGAYSCSDRPSNRVRGLRTRQFSVCTASHSASSSGQTHFYGNKSKSIWTH